MDDCGAESTIVPSAVAVMSSGDDNSGFCCGAMLPVFLGWGMTRLMRDGNIVHTCDSVPHGVDPAQDLLHVAVVV